jgi:phage shock protein A
MNIEEAEEYLNQARADEESCRADIQELHNQQAKLYARQRTLEDRLADKKQDVDHWVNVVSMIRLKANIKLASSKVSLATR